MDALLLVMALLVLYFQECMTYPDKEKGNMYTCCRGILGRHVYLTRHSQGFQLAHHLLSFAVSVSLYFGIGSGTWYSEHA